MNRIISQIILLICSMELFIIFGCGDVEVQSQEKLSLPFQEYSMTDDSIQKELDEIYSLLAYSIVFQDWQSDSIPRSGRRGYNIGTILVNANNEVVHWALNSINSTDNATQHGEVRAITSYLDSLKSYNLKNFTLYTTLEPCAMCAGMMVMTSIERVVYGQKDVDYSKALDRLALDSRKFGGFAPYPRIVISDPSPSKYKGALDEAFSSFLKSDEEKYLAKFLTTKQAYEIYQKAHQHFLKYQVVHSENQERFNKGREFLTYISK